MKTSFGNLQIGLRGIEMHRTKTLFAFIILAALACADTFTFEGTGASMTGGNLSVDSWHIGYGAIQTSSADESLTIGTIIALALLALIFFYLHAHSENDIWAHAWLFFGCLMVLNDLLAITYFAQQNDATSIATVGIAMVVVFSAVFAFSMLMFIWRVAFAILLSVKKLLRL